MAKKQFKIRAKFVFSGQVTIQAHNRQEAEALVERKVGAILGDVFVDLEVSDDVKDWDFATHGETVINRKQEAENGKARL